MIVTAGTVPASPCARLAQTCHTWSPSILTVTLGGGWEEARRGAPGPGPHGTPELAFRSPCRAASPSSPCRRPCRCPEDEDEGHVTSQFC